MNAQHRSAAVQAVFDSLVARLPTEMWFYCPIAVIYAAESAIQS